MKALVFEDYRWHKVPLGSLLEAVLETKGYEVKSAESLPEALEIMKGQMDLALIHHDGYAAVDALKAVSPKTHYIGYSNAFVEMHSPDAIRNLLEQMNQHYNTVTSSLEHLNEVLDDVINSNQ